MTEKIALVGSGLIGRSWAVLFSRGGYRVVLYDVKEQLMAEALVVIQQQLQSLHQSDLLLGTSIIIFNFLFIFAHFLFSLEFLFSSVSENVLLYSVDP